MAPSYGPTNIGSVRMSYMYGICCVPFVRKTACEKTFSNPFPKEHSDCDSQKSRFGFDLKNPPRVWILWIHDPFLDLPQQTQNPSLDLENQIGFPQKHTHSHYKEQIQPINSL